MAAIRIEARDEYGNLLSFFNEPVSFEVSGPVELIGPSVISLEGGMGGTYIKTTGECGEARLVIRNAQTEPVEVKRGNTGNGRKIKSYFWQSDAG